MSLVLSCGKKKSPIFSNDAPVSKPAVKPCELELPLKQQKKQASLSEEQGFSGIFTGSNIRSIEGCTFNFSFNSAPCSSSENIHQSKQRKRLVIFQMTLIQIRSCSLLTVRFVKSIAGKTSFQSLGTVNFAVFASLIPINCKFGRYF